MKRSKWMWALYILGLVLNSGCGLTIGNMLNPSSEEEPAPQWSVNTDTYFRDCDDVRDYISLQDYLTTKDGVVWCESAPGELSEPALAQEPGVEDLNVVNASDDLIFVQRLTDVVVVNRHTMTEIGLIPLTADKALGLYLSEDRLVLLSQTSSKTTVNVYRLDGANLPALEKSIDFGGYLMDSRLADGILVLINSDQFQTSDVGSQSVSHQGMTPISCNHLMRPTRLPRSGVTGIAAVAIHTLKISDPKPNTSSIAVDAMASAVYMNQSQIVVTKPSYSNVTIPMDGASFLPDFGVSEKSDVLQFSWSKDSGAMELKARGVVTGQVRDRWSIKGGNLGEPLFVAATSRQWTPADGIVRNNHLYALRAKEQALTIESELKDFGLDEEIRAVRFIDRLAYIVTYRQIDPLYAIDISDVKHMKIQDALKVPGFSSMLYPLRDKKLFSVGFDVDEADRWGLVKGVQVSLFDIQDPMKLSLIDSKILGSHGSFSEARYDHTAMFYRSELSLIGLPVVEFEADVDYRFKYRSSGAVFYNVNDGALTEKKRISHFPLMSDACRKALSKKTGVWRGAKITSLDVQRLLDLDGKILAVSHAGITLHNPEDLSELQVVKFTARDVNCDWK